MFANTYSRVFVNADQRDRPALLINRFLFISMPGTRPAAQPPCDEPGQLLVRERVVRLEDAQSDIAETLLSQMFGNDPHVLGGPDPVSVSGGNPGPWTTGPYRFRSYMPVEHSQVGEHRFVSR
jgi:hypothetical protein